MEEVIDFFGTHKSWVVIAHVLSVIVGMGAALVSDLLFNVYIQDKKINPTENKTLQTLSTIIWISLGMIVLTGLCLFISDPLKYAYSTKFLVKMSVVGVLIVNGFLFWKITHKALHKISFTDTNPQHKYVQIRKASFAFGAVSIISWLSAFVLGSIKTIPVSLGNALLLYAGILIVAIIGSQIAEYYLTHPKNK